MNFNPKNGHDFEPHYQALLHETLTRANLSEWLHRWSELEKHVWEMRAGFKRARSRNIEDESARQAYQQFTHEIFTPFQEVSHALQAKLLRELTWEPVYVPYLFRILRTLKLLWHRSSRVWIQRWVRCLSECAQDF